MLQQHLAKVGLVRHLEIYNILVLHYLMCILLAINVTESDKEVFDLEFLRKIRLFSDVVAK